MLDLSVAYISNLLSREETREYPTARTTLISSRNLYYVLLRASDRRGYLHSRVEE